MIERYLPHRPTRRGSPTRTFRDGIRRAKWMVVAGVAVAAGCSPSEANEAPERSVAEATRQHLQIIVEAAGELEPIRKVDVMSKASGEVVEVMVDSGDQVEAGDLLARIDPRDVQNDFNQADADYQVAVERFQIAEAQLRRSENLLEAGVITEQEHESRNLEHANAQAALVRAQTSLELSRLRLEDVTIDAPLGGTVLTRSVEEGVVISSPSGNVSGGTVLMTIADLRTVQVRTLVSEADVGRIEAGMPASVYVDAFSDRTFEGTVEKIEPQASVEQNVVNFPVIVRLDNESGILKPGMSANVSVLLAERPDALTLPNNAIVGSDEMALAGEYLGIPAERLQMDPSAFQELRRQAVDAAGSGEAGDTAVGAGRPGAAGRAGGGAVPENVQALRERLESGDLSEAEAREMMAQGRAGRGGGAGGRLAQGGNASMAGGAAAAGRPGVVFVEGADGQLSPRPVLVGITDWSNSEIIAGLEEGERVVLIGGAALQSDDSGRRFRGGIPFM